MEAAAVIVILNSDTEVLRHTADLLERLSGEEQIYLFTAAQAALGWLETHRADLVLSGVSLSDMDGIAFAETARMQQPWLHFVLMASSGERSLEAMRHRAADFLLTPVGDAALLRALRNTVW